MISSFDVVLFDKPILAQVQSTGRRILYIGSWIWSKIMPVECLYLPVGCCSAVIFHEAPCIIQINERVCRVGCRSECHIELEHVTVQNFGFQFVSQLENCLSCVFVDVSSQCDRPIELTEGLARCISVYSSSWSNNFRSVGVHFSFSNAILKAVNELGERFLHWEGASNSSHRSCGENWLHLFCNEIWN